MGLLTSLYIEIKQLIISLNKKNSKNVINELNQVFYYDILMQIVDLTGSDGKIYLLSCLIEEVLNSKISLQNNSPTIVLLLTQLNAMLCKANFSYIFCEVFF